MNIEEKAAQLFNNALVPAELNEYNRQQWVKAVKFLGEKWILSTPVTKKTK